MKALVIKPADRSFEVVELTDMQQITGIIGFDTVIADDIDDSGDKLYFDEECFLRGTEGRFQIDKLIPVSGNGVIVGNTADGLLADLNTDIDSLKARVQFID